jgi:hypothetical protein
MRDFSKGKIYAIRNTINDYVYIGSTTLNLNERFRLHKRGLSGSLYNFVNDKFNSDWSNFYIELVKDFPCNNNYELSLKEDEIISYYDNHINKNKANISMDYKNYFQNYYINNKNNYKLYNINKKLKNLIIIIILFYIHQLFNFH